VDLELIQDVEAGGCVTEVLVKRFACACLLEIAAARQLLLDASGKMGTRWAGILHAAWHYEPLYPRPPLAAEDRDLIPALSCVIERGFKECAAAKGGCK
jgi:hypothetical protein